MDLYSIQSELIAYLKIPQVRDSFIKSQLLATLTLLVISQLLTTFFRKRLRIAALVLSGHSTLPDLLTCGFIQRGDYRTIVYNLLSYCLVFH